MKPTNDKPVTGTVRWLRPLVIGGQLGRFAITVETTKGTVTTEYDVQAFLDGERVVGFGLAKDDDEVHTVDVSQWFGWTCDCADCQFRNRACKHIRGLRAALTHAGIAIPKPAPAPQASSPIEFDDP